MVAKKWAVLGIVIPLLLVSLVAVFLSLDSDNGLKEYSYTLSNNVLGTEFLTKDMVFGSEYISKDVGYTWGEFVFEVSNPLKDKQATVGYTFINFSNFPKDYVVQEICKDCGEVTNRTLVCDEVWDGNKTVKQNCVEDGGVVKTYDTWEQRGKDPHSITIEPLEEVIVKVTIYLNESKFKRKIKVDVIPHFRYTKSDLTKVDMAQEKWVLLQSDSEDLIVYLNCEDDEVIGYDRANDAYQGGANDFSVTGSVTFGTDGQGGSKECITATGSNYLEVATGSYWLGNNQDYTFCSWIKTSNTYVFVWAWGVVGGNDHLRVYDDSGSIQMHDGSQYTSDNGGDTDTWQYYCVVWDDSESQLNYYINGTSDGVDTSVGAPTYTDTDTFRLFTNDDATGSANGGSWDEIIFLNKTLPEADILALYNADGIPETPNIAPTCTESGINITVLEDSTPWTLDGNMSVATNISCSDSNGDAITYTILAGGTGTYGVYTNPNNDDLIYTLTANQSGGTDIIKLNVSDGSLSTVIHAQVTVTAVNDAPWWDDISNTTRINTGLGYQDLNINASYYFRDPESDQTPSNITVTVNESSADCMIGDSNFSLVCDPGVLQNYLIAVTLIGSDGTNEATNNFEFRASNNTPWWDDISNTTTTVITAFRGKQPVLNNASQYFRDYFDDQTPSSMDIETNESTISCSVESNLSIFCTPQCLIGDYTIILNGTDSDSNTITTSFEGNVTNTPPTIPNIILPDNETETDNETVYLVSSGSVDDEGHTVYYQFYGDTDNLPTSLVSNITGNTASWNLTSIGDYWWRSRSCDVCGLCSDYNETRYLRINFENIHTVSENYTNNQTGTGSYYYEANVTYNDVRFSGVEGTLNISNRSYYLNTEVINSTVTKLYRTLSALEEWELLTNDLVWNFSLAYTNASETYFYNSSYTGNIWVDNANFTYQADEDNNIFLNFSFKDESNNSELMASVPSGTSFVYSVDSSQAVTKTHTYSSGDVNWSYAFAFLPPAETIYNDIQFYYEAPGYTRRLYQTDATALTNTTTNTVLYLVSTADGSYTTFQVVNEASQALDDVLVESRRLISGVWTVMESRYTDDAGGVTFFVDPDQSYQFVFTKSGYEQQTLTINPTQSSYTVTMTSVTGVGEESFYLGIDYGFTPSNNVLANQSSHNFSFSITSSYYALQSAGFVLTNQTGDVLGSDSCTGSLGCTSSISSTIQRNNSYVYMNYYWQTNDTYTNGTKTWMVAEVYEGRSSFQKFFSDVEKLGRTFEMGGESSIAWQFTKALVAFFLILMVVGGIAYLSSVYSPLAVTGVSFFMILFLDVAGFIPDLGVVDNLISVIVGLMFLAVIIKELR